MIVTGSRKNIRLKNYDYSTAGYYFVTICVKDRRCLFGEIRNDETELNEFGKIAEQCWVGLPKHYPNVALDDHAIMPNHFHGIIVLTDRSNVGAGFKPAPTKQYALSEIVRGFKTFTARKINNIRNTPGISLWQRSYYERVIRNERELLEIRKYISENPLKWDLDPENPNKG